MLVVDVDELRPSPSAASRLRALERKSPQQQQQLQTPQHAAESSPAAAARRRDSSNEQFFRSMRADFKMMESHRAAGESAPVANSPATTAAAADGGGGGECSKATVSGKRATATARVYKSSSDSSDDDDERMQAASTSPPPAKKRRTLDFFMGESQAAFAADPRSTGAAAAAAAADPQQQPVCSSRTRICGQVYGRCELRFSERSVGLVLWRRQGESEKRLWQGSLLYEHLERFCFYRGASPPYLLLLEIRMAKQGNTLFSEFYDSIFAKFTQDRVDVPKPNLYGAAFYFDEEVDFVRCTSMNASFSELDELFSVPITDAEALEYFDSEVNGSATSTRVVRSSRRSSIGSTLLGGVQSVVNAVSSLYSGTDERPNTAAAPAAAEREGGSSKTDKIPGAKADQSITRFFNKKQDKQEQQQRATRSNTVVEIDDPSQSSLGGDATDEKPANGERGYATSNGGASSESKKTQVLLTYPYEDAESSSGKVSVTYGDIARLAPGEFLNDNIIDFYLRFLWRHQPSHKDQLYFYSSHFFTQLNGGGARLSPDERFARVSRWTLKGGDIFTKQFLFIPINDSFHWSVAVLCNPGSAIIQKHRKLRQVVVSRSGEVSARRPISQDDTGEPMIVDLVDQFSQFRYRGSNETGTAGGGDDTAAAAAQQQQNDCVEVREEFYEEEFEECAALRRERPPCLLFLDSLKCHRKKKFAAMLREYLESEWKSRHRGTSSSESAPRSLDDESVVTHFAADAFQLLEPEIPMQTNSSDCGVFLLMYAAEVARRFPGGVTREDVESKFAATLTAAMFDLSHVQEFRDYLHQLVFCLHSLQKRGLREECVKTEELDTFTIDI